MVFGTWNVPLYYNQVWYLFVTPDEMELYALSG